MKAAARIISAIFSPLMCPVYGVIVAMLTTVLSSLPSSTVISSVVATFIITCIIPMAGIFALLKLGHVSDSGLNNRTERTVPYVMTLICYLGAALFFYRANAPQWFCLFFIGAAVSCGINIVVNRWWKISAHAAALAGVVALMFRIVMSSLNVVSMDWWISGAIIVTGLVMTSRVYLERHTLWQVICGAANGFICVYFISNL